MVECKAMACGLPLFYHTNTGGADVNAGEGYTGHVVPIRNFEALKARILHFYENCDLAAEMGRRAQAHVFKGQTWKDYGARYAAEIWHVVETRAQTGVNARGCAAQASEAGRT